VAKEKSAKVSLIEVENEANNELLASFSTRSSGNLAIFTRHLTRAKVSDYILSTKNNSQRSHFITFQVILAR
jgi:hypothetical protein